MLFYNCPHVFGQSVYIKLNTKCVQEAFKGYDSEEMTSFDWGEADTDKGWGLYLI